MPAKKVLFLCRLYAPHVGGVEKHVEKISLELHRRGYSITVLTEQYSEDLPVVDTFASGEIIRIPKNVLSSKIALWWWVISHRALFSDVDVIHIHDVFWWVLPLSPMIRHKSFMTFHGYEGVNAPNWRQILWHRLGEVMTVGNLCIGGFHEKWYGVHPTITSFGAVDKVLPNKKSRSQHKRIMFIGRLAEDTGALVYIAGLQRLLEQEPGWTLDIFGSGPQEQEGREFVTRHKLPVVFHGFVKDAAEKIQEYDVVFVSRYLGILEALSAEVPVVGHYNNQIKKDYLIVSPFASWIQIVQSAEEVANAVKHFKPVSPTAKKWVDAQTWAVMADHYQRLWRTL